MSAWIKVCDGNVEGVRTATIGNTDLILINVEGQLSCFLDSCSHEHARLSAGEYADGELFCPKHGACFNARTGKPKTLPATESLVIFKAEQKEDGVYILWNR